MNDNKINRRNFLKGLAVTGLAVAGCSDNKSAETNVSAKNSKTVSGEMTYRINPKTGDKVSLLGYGCMRWPTKEVNGEQVIDQEEVNRLVDRAIEHGVNYFDTSPAYCRGRSEHACGIALSRHPRDKYFIATKLSNFSPNQWSREESIKLYKNSLKELQVDYIDYMLLHGCGMGGMDTYRKRYVDNGILDYLAAEREAGRIKNLGFSYHGDIEVFDHLLSQHDKYHWDFVLIQLNYVDWLHAKEVNTRNTNGEYLYNELTKRGIPAVIMEPLLGGRLTSLVTFLQERLKQRRPDDSIASWAFRYAGSFPNVLSVLSGMTYMEHLEDNLKTYSPLDPCTEEEMQMLEEIAVAMLRFPSIPCTNCQYCMPCPYGINIPEIFQHYNKCINDGNIPTSSRDENYAAARRAFLVGYDRSVPKLRQADHCIGCRACMPHCPQRIDIPKQMERINSYVEDLKQNRI